MSKTQIVLQPRDFFTPTHLSHILKVRDSSQEHRFKSWFDSEIRGIEPVSPRAEVIYKLNQRIEWSCS